MEKSEYMQKVICERVYAERCMEKGVYRGVRAWALMSYEIGKRKYTRLYRAGSQYERTQDTQARKRNPGAIASPTKMHEAIQCPTEMCGAIQSPTKMYGAIQSPTDANEALWIYTKPCGILPNL